VAAMDSCYAFIGAYQHGIAVGSMNGGNPVYQRPFSAKASAKYSFKLQDTSAIITGTFEKQTPRIRTGNKLKPYIASPLGFEPG